MRYFRDKSSNFKKFDYESDDDDFFDLDDLFGEFHGNTFNFHGFPPGILKQFSEILEAMQDMDNPQNDQRQKFENKYNAFRQKTDNDIDGQLYADQLDTLLKRISPDLMPKDSTLKAIIQKKVKQAEEEKILDIIHGTFHEETVPVKPRKRQVQKIPASPHHFGGVPPFDLPPSSVRTWGKTVISIRKPDGSYEVKKVERTSDGQTRTTITKTDTNGTSSTQSFTGEQQKQIANSSPASANYAERNLTVVDGYKIPCLWWIVKVVVASCDKSEKHLGENEKIMEKLNKVSCP